MKIHAYWAAVAIVALLVVSCNDTTDDMGGSLVNKIDKLAITTDTFQITTRSILADSVVARSTTGYLGNVRDPETGTYVTCNYMTQFHCLDNYSLPSIDSIISKTSGKIYADSCELRIFLNSFYGDSTAAMKLTAYEMNTPMSEDKVYYSNYDPTKLIRTDGIKKSKVYTIHNEAETSSYHNIRIKLNDKYTDKDGSSYNNYGTYVLQKYYKNHSNFANSFSFTHNVCPGFYFKNTGGLGVMSNILMVQLNIYFRYTSEDSTYVGTSSFAGTEEVLSTTNVENNKTALASLASVNTCTYLKTPAGIFTEVTLPIDSIMKNHENDSINTAKVVFTRINNDTKSQYALPAPETLIMIPADSIHSFFDNKEIANYRTSFLATYNSSYNTYTFNNIGSLIKSMYRNKNNGSANWNKAVVIPVQTSTSTLTSTSATLTRVVQDLSMSSTKLVGGDKNPFAPLTISVIYSNNK